MNYKSTDISLLTEEMKQRVVTFEYTKKDGTVRTAKGTMNEEYLPEKIPDQVTFDIDAVNELMKAKNIPTLEEYARGNGLKIAGTIGDKYVFVPITEKKKNENLMTYYDIEKDAFRSFSKDRFLGIIE